MEIQVRVHFDDERLLPLIHRVLSLCTPRGLTAADEDRVYQNLLRAVEHAEAAAK